MLLLRTDLIGNTKGKIASNAHTVRMWWYFVLFLKALLLKAFTISNQASLLGDDIDYKLILDD